jgi:hypothetical protein
VSDEEAEDFPEDPQLAAFLLREVPSSVPRTMAVVAESSALPSVVIEEALEADEDGTSSPYIIGFVIFIF